MRKISTPGTAEKGGTRKNNKGRRKREHTEEEKL